MDKYSLPVCTELFSSVYEKPSVFETVLPDYCPGMKKILKANAISGLVDTSFEGGVINVSAPCEIRLVYISENGSLKSVSFPHTVEASFDGSKISAQPGEVELFSKVSVPKVYAKLKNARSAEIKLESQVSVSACIFEEASLFSPETSTDTETRSASETLTQRNVIYTTENEMSDTITLDSSLPAASEIIDRSLNLYITDYICTDGCISFKGVGIFKCTYKTSEPEQDDASEYIYLKKDIPFEGEIASDTISPDSRALVDTDLTSLDVTISTDPYGENRIITVSGTYDTLSQVFNSKDVEFTYDGFCSMYECKFENSVYNYEMLADIVNKSDNMTEHIPLNGANLTEITDCDLKLGAYSTEYSEGRIYAVAKAYATITGSDDKAEPVCIEHRFTIRQSVDETNIPADRKYILCCKAMPGDATIKDGELTLEYSFGTDAAILEKKSTCAISEVDIFYDQPKPLCRSEYIIYYPDRSETLWDIAKKYEIPQSQIAAANGIDENKVFNRKTVLIPCIL